MIATTHETAMHQPDPLAAGAGEDWAALSGRPRKANADQYAGVMPQRGPARRRNAKTTTNTST